MAQRIVVTVIGRDQVGIVAKVATVLAEQRVNIEDINQKILGGNIFAMTLLADMEAATATLPELAGHLEAALGGMDLKVLVQDAEVFRYMHRV